MTRTNLKNFPKERKAGMKIIKKNVHEEEEKRKVRSAVSGLDVSGEAIRAFETRNN